MAGETRHVYTSVLRGMHYIVVQRGERINADAEEWSRDGPLL